MKSQIEIMINSLKNSADIARFDDASSAIKVIVMSQYDHPSQMPYLLTASGTAEYLSGVELNTRGFSGQTVTLITEEMVCRTGVASASARVPADSTYRALDQVVHEFGHMIDFVTGKNPYLDPSDQHDISMAWVGSDSREPFAWGSQYWFGHINGDPTTYVDTDGKIRPNSQRSMRDDLRRYFDSQFNNPDSIVTCPN